MNIEHVLAEAIKHRDKAYNACMDILTKPEAGVQITRALRSLGELLANSKPGETFAIPAQDLKWLWVFADYVNHSIGIDLAKSKLEKEKKNDLDKSSD